MKIAIAADHGGFELKKKTYDWLKANGYNISDLGNTVYEPEDDYPDFAETIARSISSKKIDRGILICGSGVGAAFAANKFKGVRASVCHDCYSARQGVEHDDLNLLCLGARVIGEELAKEIIINFLQANFNDGEKYSRRLNKIIALENKTFKDKEN